MNILNSNYFHYSGRVLEKDNSIYLGFTNSKVEFYVKGQSNQSTLIQAIIETKLNGEVNNARLKVFLDDEEFDNNLIVLDQARTTYHLITLNDTILHKITIIKITEAAMSYAKLEDILITNGDIKPFPIIVDTRLKVEFIGDSITCGYGVYGAPDSEYNISEEDGLVTYAYLTAKELNLNAQYFSVSGYGVHYKYDGDLDGVIPKIYEYTNYFVDETIKYDFSKFLPDLYVINLGTNDSGLLVTDEAKQNFVDSYLKFIDLLHSKSPNAKILCIIGTLCTNVYALIEEIVLIARQKGLMDIYSYELPYHNIEIDGMASGHPSIATHQKDSKRLIQKINELVK